MAIDENAPFVWKSGLAEQMLSPAVTAWGTRTLVPTRRNSPAAVAGLRKKDCSVALQEVLDWIGYEQRGICWKMSIL